MLGTLAAWSCEGWSWRSAQPFYCIPLTIVVLLATYMQRATLRPLVTRGVWQSGPSWSTTSRQEHPGLTGTLAEAPLLSHCGAQWLIPTP